MELIVVAAITTTLTTVVFLAVRERVVQAKLAKVANTAKMINNAATIYCMETGVWPDDVYNSVVPPELATVLPPNLFDRDVEIGGRWDWNGPPAFGRFGVSIRYPSPADADLDLLTKLDELVDDGVLSTGQARTLVHTGKLHYLFSVGGP